MGLGSSRKLKCAVSISSLASYFRFFFFVRDFKTEKQHLDFIKYNRSIPTCGFTLGHREQF